MATAHAQGCIAIRNIAGFGQYNPGENAFSSATWQVNITSRYFKSYRDFRGTTDLKTPAANQSVNHVFSTDLSVTRFLSKGWSLDLSIPVTANSRSSSLEHGGPGTTRHTTRSFGLGDARFTVYKWLMEPTVRQMFNVQLGLGIKFATGDAHSQDYFYRNDSTRVLSAVNPSIQLGDGGTGLITEVNAFWFVNPQRTWSVYGNFYYLLSPREQNGTQFTTGRTPTPVQVQAGSVEISVTDVYSARLGMNVNVQRWVFSGGLRDEGVPVHDLAGGSNGARRAGHNLSVEPGVVFRMKKSSVYAYVPVIVARKIRQNVPDKKITELTGVYTVSPGGFANYLVFAGILFRL